MLNRTRYGSTPMFGAVLLSATTVMACNADPHVNESEDYVTVCADGPTLRGVDVSYYQGSINWQSVAADGIDFAFIRVSDSTSFIDPRFAENWTGARAAGIIRGAYQFFRPNQDPIAQADILLDAIGTLEADDLPPVIDIEVTGGQSAATIVSRAKQWIDRVEAATGKQPIVYTGKYFWQDNVGSSNAFLDHPLWLAQYRSGCPDTPTPWPDWTIWQNSDSGQVAGINGPADTNFFNGDYDALLRLAGDSHLAAMGVSWERQADGHYDLSATAPAEVTNVEYYVDGFAIGSARRADSSNFAASYTFSSQTNERQFEARGFDSNGRQIAVGVGLIDVTDGVGVYVRQTGEATYEIGLERAPADVAAIEVRVDNQFLLTDAVSGSARSPRNAVRSFFFTLGQRDFKISTYNANGTLRGNLYRTFRLR